MDTITVEIPKYLRQVKLSNSRLKKYYQLGKKAPVAKKYKDRSKYEYQKVLGKMYLVEIATGERVIANPRAAGTPNYMTINGQKLYNGEMHTHTRNKVLKALKDSFAPYIEAIPVIEEFPIIIEMEIHDVIREASSNSLWDLDNRAWPYVKAFQDGLTGNCDKSGRPRNKKVIPDDNVLFITQPPVPKFIPVEHEDDRKLVFRIKSETDERILSHQGFITQLNEHGFDTKPTKET